MSQAYPNLRRSTRGSIANYSIYGDDSDEEDSLFAADDDDDDGTYSFPGSTTRLLSNRYQQQQQQRHLLEAHGRKSTGKSYHWTVDNREVKVQRWGRQLCQVGNYKVEKWEKRVLDDDWKPPDTTPRVNATEKEEEQHEVPQEDSTKMDESSDNVTSDEGSTQQQSVSETNAIQTEEDTSERK